MDALIVLTLIYLTSKHKFLCGICLATMTTFISYIHLPLQYIEFCIFFYSEIHPFAYGSAFYI